VDDVNNMDDSMDTVEQSLDGISRRAMIKASVVAGALVWSAPVLLTGKASAIHEEDDLPPDPPDEFCECLGSLVIIKIPSDSLAAINCGASCLDDRDPDIDNPMNNPDAVLCGDKEKDIVCAIQTDKLITFGPFDANGSNNPPDPANATVILDPMLTVVAASVKVSNDCYFTDCSTHFLSTAQNSGVPNTDKNGDAVSFPNRIWVTGQTVNVELPLRENITHIELLLCVSQAVTGMC
jgi:hypothetical protein